MLGVMLKYLYGSYPEILLYDKASERFSSKQKKMQCPVKGASSAESTKLQSTSSLHAYDKSILKVFQESHAQHLFKTEEENK